MIPLCSLCTLFNFEFDRFEGNINASTLFFVITLDTIMSKHNVSNVVVYMQHCRPTLRNVISCALSLWSVRTITTLITSDDITSLILSSGHLFQGVLSSLRMARSSTFIKSLFVFHLSLFVT